MSNQKIDTVKKLEESQGNVAHCFLCGKRTNPKKAQVFMGKIFHPRKCIEDAIRDFQEAHYMSLSQVLYENRCYRRVNAFLCDEKNFDNARQREEIATFSPDNLELTETRLFKLDLGTVRQDCLREYLDKPEEEKCPVFVLAIYDKIQRKKVFFLVDEGHKNAAWKFLLKNDREPRKMIFHLYEEIEYLKNEISAEEARKELALQKLREMHQKSCKKHNEKKEKTTSLDTLQVATIH